MKRTMELSGYLQAMARWTARRGHVGFKPGRRAGPATVRNRVTDGKEWLSEVGKTAGLLALAVGLFALGAVVVGVLFATLVAGLEFLPIPPGMEIVVLIGGWAVGLALLLALPFAVTVTVAKVVEVGEGWARTRAKRQGPVPAEEPLRPEVLDEDLEPLGTQR